MLCGLVGAWGQDACSVCVHVCLACRCVQECIRVQHKDSGETVNTTTGANTSEKGEAVSNDV